MVLAQPLELLFKVVMDTLDGFLTPFAVGHGHKQTLMLLLVLLLVWAVGGALIDILVPLGLALGVVKDCSDHFLAQGMASVDVEELFGGPRVIAALLEDQRLTSGH